MSQAAFETGSAPYLNADEQSLLLNALKSNQPNLKETSTGETPNPDSTGLSTQVDSGIFDGLNDASFFDGHFDANNISWDLDASALDDSQNDPNQDSSNSLDGDDGSPNDQTGDKRKDRDDELSQSGEGGNKRRESEEKVAKKPGRKPMTNEPTSKRKAQNRAAQRAFRERKEKHLRDLEQKVEDLEKASEATNHENGVLRAQVDRLQAELGEYKKRIGTSSRMSYPPTQPNSKFNWDISQNFDFEFPKFGVDNAATNKSSECVKSMNALSEMEKQDAERDFFRSASLTWSPSPLTNSRTMSSSTYFENGRSPVNTARSPTSNTEKSMSTSESPASLGLASSVCTTPEATVDSPGQYKSGDKKASTSPSQPKTPAQDGNGNLDWFASQGNGLFDPVLIDAYREPQDSILNNADLNLSFFDDAFPWNPASNWSAPLSNTGSSYDSTAQGKKSLIDRVEQAAEGKEHDRFSSFTSLTTRDDNGEPRQITCAKLWDRVQRSEKVLSGAADMDDLCSQLKAKAKCGGPNKGAVVDERDVDAILGPDPAKKKKATGMYGMFT